MLYAILTVTTLESTRDFGLFGFSVPNSKFRKNIFCEQKGNKLPVSKKFLEKFPTFHLLPVGSKKKAGAEPRPV